MIRKIFVTSQSKNDFRLKMSLVVLVFWSTSQFVLMISWIGGSLGL